MIQLEKALNLATEDAKHWEEACNSIVDILGATGVVFAPTDPNFRGKWMSCCTRLGLALDEYISKGWHLDDPREKITRIMLKNGYSGDDELFPDRSVKNDIPFYTQFLFPRNFGVSFAVRILTPNGYWAMVLHYDNDHPPICEADLVLIKKVQRLIENAVTKADEIALKRIATFAQFFKGSKSEVYIFDADGNQCLNMDNNGSFRAQNNLSSLLPIETNLELRSDLSEICASESNLSLSKAYQIREQDKNINLLIIQIPPNLRHFFMHFKVCAIKTECSDTSAIKQNHLRENFQLSDSEIATVDLLSSGNTPAMIAELMSLKASSIRQRLKVIYNKTNVQSQIELIALYGKL
ncbi:MAG: hypothetical protein OCD03_10140 [Hyphomicrobiales bacterium]